MVVHLSRHKQIVILSANNWVLYNVHKGNILLLISNKKKLAFESNQKKHLEKDRCHTCSCLWIATVRAYKNIFNKNCRPNIPQRIYYHCFKG